MTCVDGSWSEDITCHEITSDQNTSIGILTFSKLSFQFMQIIKTISKIESANLSLPIFNISQH